MIYLNHQDKSTQCIYNSASGCAGSRIIQVQSQTNPHMLLKNIYGIKSSTHHHNGGFTVELRTLLSPKVDIIFKKVFGSTNNEDILKAFLKAVLGLPEEEYLSLTLVNPSISPMSSDGKTVVMDIKAATSSGHAINVEMQRRSVPGMRERMALYTSRMLVDQARKGEDYSHLKKAISIVITDYRLVGENENVHNRYYIQDRYNDAPFTEILEVHTLELPKVPGIGAGNNNDLLYWLQLFSATSWNELYELAERSKEMSKAVSIIQELNSDEEIRMLAEAREKQEWDERSRISDAAQKGKVIGKYEVAQKMLIAGMSIEQIALFTELPIEDIAKLRQPE
jgi:conserved hypothetical protein (putative transposase or invertase)